MMALLVEDLCERTLVDVGSELVVNLFLRLKSLLVRGCSMRDKTLAERSIQERQVENSGVKGEEG
jgi:hypothetical protein